MTSVPPTTASVRCCWAARGASDLAALLTSWGMDATVVSEQLGVASAIKLCRSVMIKGLEALVIESYATARAYGVKTTYCPRCRRLSPDRLEPAGRLLLQPRRAARKRRAEEMREAANTVREAGFAPLMASAIADNAVGG